MRWCGRSHRWAPQLNICSGSFVKHCDQGGKGGGRRMSLLRGSFRLFGGTHNSHPALYLFLCLQTAVVSFTQLAVCPQQAYSSSQVQTLLAEEANALQRLAPIDSSFKNFSQLRTSSAAADGAAAAGNGSSRGFDGSAQRQQQAAGGAGGGTGQRAKPVQASYAQLMGMRVKELKRLLQEHNIDSSDCFEKEELVNRVLQRCTAQQQA